MLWVGGGVLTVGAGPRHSWRRCSWVLLAGVFPLAPLVLLLPMVSYRMVSPWWLSLFASRAGVFGDADGGGALGVTCCRGRGGGGRGVLGDGTLARHR